MMPESFSFGGGLRRLRGVFGCVTSARDALLVLALATTLPVWDARAADPQPPFRTLLVPAGRQDAGGPPPVYGSATIQPGGSVQFLFGVECYDLSGNHVDDTVTLSVSVTPATPALSVSLAPNPVKTFEPPSTVTVSAAAAIVPQVYHLTGVGHGPVCGTYTGWSADVTVECAGGGAVGVAAAGTCPTKCELPTGEGTVFAGWWHDTVGLWEQRLKPAGTSFEGRQVKETDPGGGSDACYFPGSIIKQFNKVTGGTWPVEALNAWGPDHVGRSARAVTYYRTKGRAPCESTIPQQMVINCPTDKLDHKYGPVNTLKYRITGVAVSSVRAGHSKTELYPAPAGAAADAGPATEGPLASPSPAPGAPVRAGEATASDPRPVAKAAEQLERLYRVPITYEDPAYAYPGAIDDVTAAVRRGPAAPGPAGRVLVPRGGTISYTESG